MSTETTPEKTTTLYRAPPWVTNPVDAASAAIERMGPGDRASLRRLRPEQLHEPAFWKLTTTTLNAHLPTTPAARDAAEQSVRAKSTFVAMMSHELRTPLNAIVGYSELIHDDLVAREQPRLAADIDRVRTAGQHLAAIISDILDYSKLEADRLVLAPEAVAVEPLLRGAAGHVRAEAEARGLDVVVQVAAGAHTVVADPLRLAQVVGNLVSNAVKFTDRGRVVLRARRSPVRGGRLVITVHDTGAGIPADKRDRLFQPFSQVDGSLTRRAGGTGLGLVISQRLVAVSGGTLRVRSRVGHGSTFRVSLPLAAAPAKEAA